MPKGSDFRGGRREAPALHLAVLQRHGVPVLPAAAGAGRLAWWRSGHLLPACRGEGAWLLLLPSGLLGWQALAEGLEDVALAGHALEVGARLAVPRLVVELAASGHGGLHLGACLEVLLVELGLEVHLLH